ncbi:Patched protein homolog 1, putative [Brugia malayi]|uniref:Patched protein homolog 1, putative n=1 Tax=Brugia malayi TaxID=6279 RepID=A0A4E9FBE3_BRUMA|nr:Patched protein homolog 1, putative [Brugia malayi]VIO93378.1 Patched protein homolog 1, putative [Brugia malayi]
MLLLIEPPGTKHHNVTGSDTQHGQHLLEYSTPEEDEEPDCDDINPPTTVETVASCAQKIDQFLVGKSNSCEFSDRWKREFSERPSWCDADMALQQIKRGKARGSRAALYSRSLIQKALFTLGTFVHHHACLVIFTVIMFFCFCCYGLRYVRIETDVVKLWVARGGRLEEELNFLSRIEKSSSDKAHGETGLGGAYQVVIQTPTVEGDNILTQEGLLEHVTILEEIAKYKVNVAGENWTLADLCFKPPAPKIDKLFAEFVPLIDKIIPCIWITPIDCFWEGSKAIGPHPSIESSSLGFGKEFLTSLSNMDTLSWSNIDPQALLDELAEILDLGDFNSFFHRANIGRGYLDRWCIDPLNTECPTGSPNHFAFCDLIARFLEYAKKHGFEVPIDPEYLHREERKKNQEDEYSIFPFFGIRQKRSLKKSTDNYLNLDGTSNDANRSELSFNDAEAIKTNITKLETVHFLSKLTGNSTNNEQVGTSTVGSKSVGLLEPLKITTPNPKRGSIAYQDDNDFLYEDDEDKEINLNAELCAKYARSFSEWLRNNTDKWHELLKLHEMPLLPNYGEVMTGGCRSFAKDVMSWPQDLIIGGVRIKNGTIESAEALQSVFLVASPTDIYNRFKDGDRIYSKRNLNLTQWNVTVAETVIKTWQRNFTRNLYNHQSNFIIDQKSDAKIVHRRIHPLASTSVTDMLEQFCKFNYSIIFIGYFLMLIYALQAQMKCHGCMLAVDSCIGLAFAGVLTVTFASIAGLGLSTWLGIEFNAATTQIVPFLTLGIGVDNIFLLLHNYHSVMDNVKKDEVGILMKETGMSVMMTSINNILSFLAGTLLPIPALRAFCAQSSILLTFNLIAVLTIFPAIISIDLCRRKSFRRDICCCSVISSFAREGSYMIDVGVKPHIQEKLTVGGTVPSYHNLYSPNDRSDDMEDDLVKPWTLHAFLRHYYIPFLKKGVVKIFVILTCLCLLFAGLIGLRNTTFGLEMSDVLPDQTAPAAFLKARDRYFSFYPMFAVLRGPGIDYAKNQHKIDDYRLTIGSSPFVVKNSEKEPSERYWLSMLRIWLQNLQQKLDQAIADGLIDASTGTIAGEGTDFVGETEKLSTDVNIAYRLACSYGYTYNCTGRIGRVRFVDESGTINMESFYNYLTAWYNSDKMMYHVSLASFIPSPPEWTIENKTRLIPPAGPFEYSQIPFYLTNLSSTPVIIEMVKEIRAICDEFTANGLPNFPTGVAFTFWEQYLHLSGNLFQAICVIAFAVFCVISIIICNPWAAGIILIILLLMTVELTGFLGLVGIKLNPISAVTVITAVGIGVEFTAHVVLAFLTSLGTRNDRMASCIDRVFVPVIHGAFSTLLGIIMLAFSEFEFVVKYFFIVMTALIFIGVINGLALLPVLLSLIGPPCEIEPLDGSHRLSPPPPLQRRIQRTVQESQVHRRNCSDDSNTATLGSENCSTMLLISPPRSGNGGLSGAPRLVPNSHARSASAHIV